MNNLRDFSLAFFLLLNLQISNAQTPNSISGIINRYAAVTAIDTCSGKLTVSDTTGFRAGAPILLIQMQGADIVSGNNLFYGVIQSMNFAGFYERAVIDSVAQNAIFVQKRFVYAYFTPGKLQAVTIPQFANAVVTDTLRCQSWNGVTGGVLALEVAGNLTLNAPIIADGAGFRGGGSYIATNNNCNFLIPELSLYYASGSWRGAYKGEGIALFEVGKELGRGPQANGGGGGNDHNSGGGGGANISDGGGGGFNDEPTILGCDGYYPGIRGYGAFSATIDNQMFLGGGGGAGHSNNTLSSAGGNGGGLVIISAGSINGSVPVVSANGLSAQTAQGDGAGGGGAGGTIWLKANSAPGNLVVRTNGGDGGNTFNNDANRCFGPGGGGSGGRILTNLSGIATPSGGKAGIITNSSNDCNGSNSETDDGETGFVQPPPDIPQGTFDYSIPEILSAPLPDTVCASETVIFVVQTNDGAWDFQWQINDGTGWQDIAGGAQFSGFQNDTLIVSNVTIGQNGLQFRCRVLRVGCYETVSIGAAISVYPVPTTDFSTSVNGYTADFTNLSSATNYFWDFGDGTTSQTANPQHTYATEGTFAVTLYAITACDTVAKTQTIVILLPPTAGFFVQDSTLSCQSVTLIFENTSSANVATFNWFFPGGNPATSSVQNPSVTYSNSGTYTAQLIVSNSIGSDTLEQIFSVQIFNFPTANFTWTAFPAA